LKKLLEISDNKSIIFIDAIDEINDDEIKKQIKELLQNTKSKIIIT
jgi:tRNA(Ser,Leu) C12 N-acetylase TAN1